MKSTRLNSSTWKLVELGHPIRKNSSFIPVRRLESFLRYCHSLDILCRAISYSITVPLIRRNSKEWDIFWAVSDCKDMDLIAVFSYKEKPSSFSDINAIDFSILMRSEGLLLLEEFPQLKNILLSELGMVVYGRT